MMRKITILLMTLSLCWTTFACSSPEPIQSQRNPGTNTNTYSAPTQLREGQYPVQQANYDDGTGEYTLMLLNTSAGAPPVFRTTDLQMARLTDEEIQQGQRSYLEMRGGQAVLHLTEDFKIEYVHNVTETQTDPQTGQQQTVVVRQQSGFWAPFAGAVAGQALGSLLFSPRYYMPPVYQPGIVMRGYGGYGNTYGQAVDQYRSRYQSLPPVERNRQTFRTTGRLRRSPSYGQPAAVRRTPRQNTRTTGSGYGSSRLRRSNQSTPSRANRPSFGSGSRGRRPMRARRR